MAKKSPSLLPRLIGRLDNFQQRHKIIGLPLAIIKKYGDDSGGYQAALITYYSFLSLFPLLLVIATVTQIWFKNNPHLHAEILNSIDAYFPLLGDQLQHNIHSMRRTGIGLTIGLLFTVYGARGAADALRFALDNIWQVPRHKRPGFPRSALQSLLIMGGALMGFLAGTAASLFSASLGHAVWTKLLINVIGFGIATITILFIFSQATARSVPVRDMIGGSTIAGFLLQMLLTFGSLLVAHELKGLNSVYGVFAIVLGLIFWLYLLAQIIVYSAEFDSVRHLQLWPRGLRGNHPTDADKRTQKLRDAEII